MSGNPQNDDIELEIERLVLHDFPHADRYRIGEAIMRALQQQLGASGASDALAQQQSISRLIAHPIQIDAGGNPERVGTQVARAIYSSITTSKNQARGTASGYHSDAGWADGTG